MLSKADRNYARLCSEELQKLYELAHKWQRLSSGQLPWLPGFCKDIVTLHTRLNWYVEQWDRDPPNDDAFAPAVSGKSGWSGNF
mgnify:CR=1 FL=1